jgi:EAL domain-containing protein (putative c-di-GMP-specific phosphodiesterase class I)
MPIVIGSFTVHITVSIGVSVWPDDAKTRSDLMRHADIAMYIAKNRREGGVSFFDHSLNERVERANKIDLALRKVDYDGEFELNFQPQITVGGQRLVGAEALVRWSSPELGIVCPDEFIPVAEENGTIIAMSDWIMKHAFLRIADWNRRYNKELLMGVNISPIQMDASDFLMKLESLLDETKALPDWINLEMTERSAMKDATFIIEIFNRLAELNITTSIDDFGTGYSSLSYLKKFNIDYLKIAKELVDGIAESDTDRDIVQAIIMMSTALGLHTIAEGVEDENQLRLLTSLGCDEIQGYYFGKPVSSDEFEELYLKE